MSDAPGVSRVGDHEVGYAKPPVRTRFRKGQSGNPGGRPGGVRAGRLKALAIKEAYRMVRIKEGDRVTSLPAIKAILRSQVMHAAKGNGPAQRAVIEVVNAIEHEQATQAANEAKDRAEERPISDIEAGRRIAWLLQAAAREPGTTMAAGGPTTMRTSTKSDHS